MTDPCEKGPQIDVLQKTQIEQGAKLDQVLKNQQDLGETMTTALNKLTAMMEKDIGTRMEVEQLKKDRDRLYEKSRENAVEIRGINERNARCDGAGIFENFPKMYDWYQANIAKSEQFVKVYAWYLGELGWRRFMPGSMAFFSFAILIYVTFFKDA